MNSQMENVSISPAPEGLEKEYFEIFTEKAILFVSELVSEFQKRTYMILRDRKICKLTLENSIELEIPKFTSPSYKVEPDRRELFEDVKSIPGPYHEEWQISPLPPRLQNRNLDLGDVSPSETELLKAALQCEVQGIQVDFDDGHCPTWANQIKGIHNVVSIMNNTFYPDEVPPPQKSPVLMLRPRAWNMNEHNFMVNGKEIPGPLMDFGLLIYHIGNKSAEKGIGPYFYLSKVENATEARLWDDIFIWAENKLSLTPATIKACVLIENILAAFEMEQILFELRHHSLGLNCGIWDYAASFVNKFGTRENFILPDRNKYVSMDKPFLRDYMKLVLKTCHQHGAPATGGMIAFILSAIPENEPASRKELLRKICAAKRTEIEVGLDGFLVYDTSLVPFLVDLWKECDKMPKLDFTSFVITEEGLLDIPKGGVTFIGLQKNIKVGLLFIYSWLMDGKGHFILDGAVEDSATAEISRSQIWQWIYHHIHLEDDMQKQITKSFVTSIAWDICQHLIQDKSRYDESVLRTSCEMLLELATQYEFPEFITTYLYNHSFFRKIQKS